MDISQIQKIHFDSLKVKYKKRFVWNFALELLKASWQFEGVIASDAKRLKQIKKVFNNNLKTLPEYSWMNNYPSTIYQSVFQENPEPQTLQQF